MSHNVSLPYCIHSRICRMFYHLLLIMLLCLSCTSADCFKPPMCNGFSFFVYLFLYCHASGCPLTCCCSLGFCKCHWPSRKCKSIGRCKPWDPALLSKGRVLSIFSFAVEKYRFEWWQPNIKDSRKQPMWNLVCGVPRAHTVCWNQWRRGRGGRDNLCRAVSPRNRGGSRSAPAMTRDELGCLARDHLWDCSLVSGEAERCQGTWTPGSLRKVLYLQHWIRAWEN